MKDIKSVFEKLGLMEKVPATINFEAEQENNECQEDRQEVLPDKIEKIEEPLIQAQIKSQNKKLLGITEIYNNFNVKSEGINSLFIIESFSKALPDYLPANVKRESVLNIISSSGLSLGSLITDGNVKLKYLKEFSQSFSEEIKNAHIKYEAEIQKLSAIIDNYHREINEIDALKEEQVSIVEYEIKRIDEIIQFIAVADK